MDSAQQEIHQRGYQAASLQEILARAGVTKGALYHHFPHKKALGLAVLERLAQMVERMWLAPLEGAADPVTALQEAIRAAGQSLGWEDLLLGCPLQNLAGEMAPLDEDFRRGAAEIYQMWRDGVAAALAQGQRQGLVRPELDPGAAAVFFVAALSGGRTQAKTARDAGLLAATAATLVAWLDTLRVPGTGDRASA